MATVKNSSENPRSIILTVIEKNGSKSHTKIVTADIVASYEHTYTVDVEKSNELHDKQLKKFFKKLKPIDWKKESKKYIQQAIKESHAITQVINDSYGITEVIVSNKLLTVSERANLELFEKNGCFKVTYIG